MTRTSRLLTAVAIGLCIAGVSAAPLVTHADIWNPDDFSSLGGNVSAYDMGLELQILQLELQLSQISSGNNMGFASVGSIDGAVDVGTTTASSTGISGTLTQTTPSGGPLIVSSSTLTNSTTATGGQDTATSPSIYVAPTDPAAVGSFQGYANGRMFANYENTTRSNAFETCANQDAKYANTVAIDKVLCIWNGEVIYSASN